MFFSPEFSNPPPPFQFFTNGDVSDSDASADSDSDSDIEPIVLDDEPHVQIVDHAYPQCTIEKPLIPKDDSPLCHFTSNDCPVVKPLPLSPKCKASLPKAPKPLLHLDPDDEADYFSTSEDDDYVPSPPLNPKKRPRSTPSRRSGSSRSSSSLTKASPSPSSRPLKKQRIAPLSRNKQSARPEELNRLASIKRTADDSFVCPECGFRSTNKRSPDFSRHLKSHARPSDDDKTQGWWCKGVLVDEGPMWSAKGDTFTFAGKRRVGGCCRSFSRRDALKRHIDNSNVPCVGKPVPADEEPVHDSNLSE